MKTTNFFLFILSLLIFVSCETSSNGTLPKAHRLWEQDKWNVTTGTTFEAASFTSDTATFYNVDLSGVKSDCVYHADIHAATEYLGTMDLTYASGNSSVCAQLVGNQPYSVGSNVMAIAGHDLD